MKEVHFLETLCICNEKYFSSWLHPLSGKIKTFGDQQKGKINISSFFNRFSCLHLNIDLKLKSVKGNHFK